MHTNVRMHTRTHAHTQDQEFAKAIQESKVALAVEQSKKNQGPLAKLILAVDVVGSKRKRKKASKHKKKRQKGPTKVNQRIKAVLQSLQQQLKQETLLNAKEQKMPEESKMQSILKSVTEGYDFSTSSKSQGLSSSLKSSGDNPRKQILLMPGKKKLIVRMGSRKDTNSEDWHVFNGIVDDLRAHGLLTAEV